jgi:hypothetical protein
MNRLIKLTGALLLILPLSLPAAAASADEGVYSQAELDQMLAPIALYPDTVLSHVLIAATYPLEVVQAARWSRANPGMDGDRAVAAVEDRDWDPSVKALVAFPDLLARMSEELDWTRDLGEAFLGQEEQVVDTVQVLRGRAYAEGHLESNDHLTVRREQRIIYLEPRVREIVYVPWYDTRVVYGSWWWSGYPPVFWGYPAGYYPHMVFYWGHGFRVSSRFYFSWFHWPHRHVVVVHHHHHHHHHAGRTGTGKDRAIRWRHDPKHRRGVGYRNEQVGFQYGSHQLERPDPAPRFRQSVDRGNPQVRTPDRRTEPQRHGAPRFTAPATRPDSPRSDSPGTGPAVRLQPETGGVNLRSRSDAGAQPIPPVRPAPTPVQRPEPGSARDSAIRQPVNRGGFRGPSPPEPPVAPDRSRGAQARDQRAQERR